jgi:hypothetical protein
MKIEQQVVSFELAIKLKELGIKQESLYWYNKEGELITSGYFHYKEKSTYISAFTVAELGDILPKGGWSQESTYGGYRVWMFDRDPPHEQKEFTWAETEANARAKMLIYLIENKLITLE